MPDPNSVQTLESLGIAREMHKPERPLPMDERAVRDRALLELLCKMSSERNAEIMAMPPDDPRRPDFDEPAHD